MKFKRQNGRFYGWVNVYDVSNDPNPPSSGWDTGRIAVEIYPTKKLAITNAEHNKHIPLVCTTKIFWTESSSRNSSEVKRSAE